MLVFFDFALTYIFYIYILKERERHALASFIFVVDSVSLKAERVVALIAIYQKKNNIITIFKTTTPNIKAVKPFIIADIDNIELASIIFIIKIITNIYIITEKYKIKKVPTLYVNTFFQNYLKHFANPCISL